MLKKFRPKTHSMRHMIRVDKSMLSKVDAEKSLTKKLTYKAARDNKGHITVRGRGGRVSRRYREIDLGRNVRNVPGTIKTIEYDPNRTCYISLVVYPTGKKAYILTTKDMKVGDSVLASDSCEIKNGNALKLKNIPSGTFVNNIQLKPGLEAGTMVRSAGASAIVMGANGEYVQIKLPSGEIRLINGDCYATIGQLSNTDNINQTFGKSGTLRKMGFRPIVRGVAQHPRSHPHGGGQGKAGRHGTGGPAVDPWGNKRFKKTRNNRVSDRFIVQTRKGRKLMKLD